MGLLRLKMLSAAVQSLEDTLKKDLKELVKSQMQLALAEREAARDAAAESDAAAAGGEGGALAAREEAAAEAAKGERERERERGGKAEKTVMTQLRELSVDGFESVMSRLAGPLMMLLRRGSRGHSTKQRAIGCARPPTGPHCAPLGLLVRSISSHGRLSR